MIQDFDEVGSWNIDELTDLQVRQVLAEVIQHLKLTVYFYNNENTKDRDVFEVRNADS